ncbi:MAG: ROK family protein [Dehalococcoidia bacterium]
MSSILTMGVDVGGTKVETALVDAGGNIVKTNRRSTGVQSTPEGFLADMAACLKELRASTPGESIGAIGLGIAGQIDPEAGRLRTSPNLPEWNDVPLRDDLERKLGIPAVVLNDVQAATWGEWHVGAGRGESDMLCMFVGTGVGGGLVAGGQMLRGSTGSAGELGHILLDMNGPVCTCGRIGCLEAHAGGWAIALRVQRAVAADPEAGKALLALAGDDPKMLSAATIAEAAHGGDPLALRLVAEIGEALGAGIASMVNAFNPRLVILGGGVVEGIPELIDIAREGVRQRALPSAAEAVRITRAQLGGYAAVIGAALMARQRLEGEV